MFVALRADYHLEPKDTKQLRGRHSIAAPYPKHPHWQPVLAGQLQDRRTLPAKQPPNHRPHRYRRLLPRIRQPRWPNISNLQGQSMSAVWTCRCFSQDPPSWIHGPRCKGRVIALALCIRHQALAKTTLKAGTVLTGPHRGNTGPLPTPHRFAILPQGNAPVSLVRSRIAPEAGMREIATPNKHHQVPDQMRASPPFIADDPACSAVGATQPQ